MAKRVVGRLGTLAITPSYHKLCTGHLWFLHGSCDNGLSFQSWIRHVLQQNFSFYNYKVFYPTAPRQKYDLLNGQETRIWYNRAKISPDFPEDIVSIEKTGKMLEQSILAKAKLDNVPLSRIIIGGFSQGGTMALHVAYRLMPQIAGCFAFSSFLPPDSTVFESIEKRHPKIKSTPRASDSAPPPLPVLDATTLTPASKTALSKLPNLEKILSVYDHDSEKSRKVAMPLLFMSQGMQDPLVLPSWGRSTFVKLQDRQVQGTFYSIPNWDHCIHPVQLQLLHRWISKTLSTESCDTVALDDHTQRN